MNGRLHTLLILLALIFSACATRSGVKQSSEAPPSTETSATAEPSPIPQPEARVFDRPVTILFAGDIMMGSSAAGKMKAQGPDSFFTGTREFIEGADAAVGNLEAPLGTEGEKIVEKTYTFLVDPRAAKGLKNAGFDILTLANNHILDFGPVALQSTFRTLKEADLRYSGAGDDLEAARRPAWFEAAGRKVAVLAYSLTYPLEFWATGSRPGCAPADGGMIREDVTKARAEGADLVFVCAHWGREKETKLRPYQRPLAHAAVEAGADGVIGHHPHIWQGVELYRQKPIAYSIGNFAFGSYSASAAESGLLRLVFDEKGRFAGASIVPLNVRNSEVQFTPKPLTGARLLGFFTKLRSLSPGVDLSLKDDQIEWVPPGGR